MPQSYSQFKAFAAITKAALRSIAKSPSSVVFTIAFPLVFILVFGFLGSGSNYSINIGIAPGSDTLNPVYLGLKQVDIIKMAETEDAGTLQQQLQKGTISALVHIQDTKGIPRYNVSMQVNAADQDKAKQLQSVIERILLSQDRAATARLQEMLSISQTIVQSRKFRTIDFILPGQLGFSLLAASVFGTAFVFFNLRQALVLKRFFATPIRREFIILGEGAARMIFQLIGALLIIMVGHFAFGYTLINGAL
ncbi:MAG TPA: ABC transporter permease, partial [Flavisolibacter sp.]|nr:ABC transporter permease [Flavisolibacter sp.]